MNDLKFTVVIVTYNRLDCLKKSLKCYSEQSYKPRKLIVVDNASTDNTSIFLAKWKEKEEGFDKIVIKNERNLGGAGGFSVGVDEARKTECDFIFLADDDAYADEEALKILNEYYKKTPNRDDISALCTSVINFGEYDLVHRRRVKKGLMYIKRISVDSREYSMDSFDIDEFSFVGVAIKRTVVEKVGLPKSEYFIYFDDTEYSHRVEKKGRIVCVPDSIMNHNVAAGHDDNDVTWRSYYSLRNSLDILLKYYPIRYFYIEAFTHYIRRCTFITRMIKHRTRKQTQLLVDAIKDAKDGKIVRSEKYYPGSRF